MNTETSKVADAEIPVRYEVAGTVIEIDKVNRFSRLLLNHHTKKLRKQYAHLKGVRDSEGKGVTIIIRQPNPGIKSVECVVEFPEGMKDQIKDSDKAVRVS
jgi:hypothetical protein|nr:hypothetical protein [Neorhizobium tomejilense]